MTSELPVCVASISDDFQAPAAVKGDVVILRVVEGLDALGARLESRPWRG